MYYKELLLGSDDARSIKHLYLLSMGQFSESSAYEAVFRKLVT
jgi:hypothetical protein